MNKEHFVDLSKDRYNLELILILFLSLSFILSDWLISVFTFSDFFIGASLLLLFFSKQLKIKRTDLKYFILIEGYLFFNILLNHYFNNDFEIKYGISNFIKIFYYQLYVVSMYNFILERRLKESVLKWLNVFAIFSIVIGVYISTVLIFNLDLPYEFIWRFTRTDASSYIYRGSENLVRMRSVFSEPAHIGYFLNLVLALNLFVSKKLETYFYNIIIIFGIMITFSYASIGVMSIILLIKSSMYLMKLKRESLDIKMLIPAIVLLVSVYYFRGFLYETLIVRTSDIIQGEDGSFTYRIFYSWYYINDNIVLGNGLGHTPPIQNIYAYMISDLGVVAFVVSILFTMKLLLLNIGIGVTFIALNFQKGGYLSPAFSIVMLLILVFIKNTPNKKGEILDDNKYSYTNS